MTIGANKSRLREYCEACRDPSQERFGSAVTRFFAAHAQINIVHPFEDVGGPDGYIGKFLAPLLDAFDHLHRSDYIACGGEFEGSQWVTCTGYYSGLFKKDWLGIRPTGALAFLRFGEFHRMESGRAVESYIFLDIPELMIACGKWPIIDSPGRDRGFTGYLPGPITQDGLQWHMNDPARSASSVEMVTAMLRSLATEDQAWRPYWHKDMLWYGPAAFGSFAGIEGFAGFQVPFENTFSEWIGGSVSGSQTRHFARFADGDYVASGGWPSLNMIQEKPFLDQSPTSARLFMRVCDWWRRDGDLLAENWVFVDVPHVLMQLGFDLFSSIRKEAE